MPEYPDQFGQGPLLDPEVLGRMPEYLQPQYAQYTQPPSPEEEPEAYDPRRFLDDVRDLAIADSKLRAWTMKNDPHAVVDSPGRFRMGERVIAMQSIVNKERADEAEAGRSRILDLPLRTAEYMVPRLPFVGGFIRAAEQHRQNDATNKIKDGSATALDLRNFATNMAVAAEREDQHWIHDALDIASYMPGYVAEFIATGPIGGAAGAATKAGVLGMIGRRAAASGMGLKLAKTAGFFGNAGGRLLHPAFYGMAADITAQNRATILGIEVDEANRFNMTVEREADGFEEAIGKGAALAYVEILSESLGGPAGRGLSKLANKVPILRDLKGLVARRWMGLRPGNTFRRFQNVMRKGGWNGIVMELGEEHVANILSWGVGGAFGETQERAWERMGHTGLLFEGRLGEFFLEERTMFVGFLLFPMAQTVVAAMDQQAELGEKIEQELFDLSTSPEQAASVIEKARQSVDFDRQDPEMLLEKSALELFIQRDPQAAQDLVERHADGSTASRKEFRELGLPYYTNEEFRREYVSRLKDWTAESYGQHFEPNAAIDEFLGSITTLKPLEKRAIRQRMQGYYDANPEIDIQNELQALHPDVMDHAFSDQKVAEEYRRFYEGKMIDLQYPKQQAEDIRSMKGQLREALSTYNSMEAGPERDLLRASMENMQAELWRVTEEREAGVPAAEAQPVPPVEEMPPEAPVGVPEAPVAAPEAPIPAPAPVVRGPMDVLQEAHPELAERYAQDAGVTEGYTVGEHTRRVSENWEREKPRNISEIGQSYGIENFDQLFQDAVALHDIGKGEAVLAGDKGRQHEFTDPILRDILEREGHSPAGIELVAQLMSRDLVGEYLKGNIASSEAVDQIRLTAEQVGMKPSDVLKLSLSLYKADVSDYPELREKIFGKGKPVEFGILEEVFHGEVLDSPWVRRFRADATGDSAAVAEAVRFNPLLHASAVWFEKFDPDRDVGKNLFGPGIYLLAERDDDIAEHYARRAIRRVLKSFKKKFRIELSDMEPGKIQAILDSDLFKEEMAKAKGNPKREAVVKEAIEALEGLRDRRIGQIILTTEVQPEKVFDLGAYETGGRRLSREEVDEIVAALHEIDPESIHEESLKILGPNVHLDAEGRPRAVAFYRGMVELLANKGKLGTFQQRKSLKYAIAQKKFTKALLDLGYDALIFVHPQGGFKRPYQVLVHLDPSAIDFTDIKRKEQGLFVSKKEKREAREAEEKAVEPVPAEEKVEEAPKEEAPVAEGWGQYTSEMRVSLEARGYEMGESGLYEKRSKRGRLIYGHPPIPDATSEEKKAKSRFMTLTDDDGKMLARSLIILRSENWEDAKQGAEALQLFMEMENDKKAEERRLWNEHLLPAKGQKDVGGRSRNDKLLYYARSAKNAREKTIELRNVIAGLDETAQEMNIELQELEDLINKGYPAGIKLNSEATVDYLKGEFEWGELPPPVQAWWGPRLEEEEKEEKEDRGYPATWDIEEEEEEAPKKKKFVPKEKMTLDVAKGVARAIFKEMVEGTWQLGKRRGSLDNALFVAENLRKKHGKEVGDAFEQEFRSLWDPWIKTAAPAPGAAPAATREGQILGEVERRGLDTAQIKKLLAETPVGHFVPAKDSARSVEILQQRLAKELEKAEVLLNIPPGSSLDEVGKLYRKFSRKYHPDTGGPAKKFARGAQAHKLFETWFEITDSETTPAAAAVPTEEAAPARPVEPPPEKKRIGVKPVPAAEEGPVPGKDKVYGPDFYVTNLLDEEADWDQVRFIKEGDDQGYNLEEVSKRFEEQSQAYNNLSRLTDEQLLALDINYDTDVGREGLDRAWEGAHQNAMDTASQYGVPFEDSHTGPGFGVRLLFEVVNIDFAFDGAGVRWEDWTDKQKKPTIDDVSEPTPAEEPFELEKEKKKVGPEPEQFVPEEQEQMVLFRGLQEDPEQRDFIEEQEAQPVPAAEEGFSVDLASIRSSSELPRYWHNYITEMPFRTAFSDAFHGMNLEKAGENIVVVHGTVIAGGERVDHAWLEQGDEVIDPGGEGYITKKPTSTGFVVEEGAERPRTVFAKGIRLPKHEYYSFANAEAESRYTKEQMRANTREIDAPYPFSYGPWMPKELETRQTTKVDVRLDIPKEEDRSSVIDERVAQAIKLHAESIGRSPAEPAPAAEKKELSEKEKKDDAYLASMFEGDTARMLLDAKEAVKASVGGYTVEQFHSAIDRELRKWAKKEKLDPGELERLEEEGGFQVDLGHYSNNTNTADIEAYLKENYEDFEALKRLAPELAERFINKTSLVKAIASAQARSVRANHIIDHGKEHAPEIVSKKSGKTGFKMEGFKASENPGKLGKTPGKNTKEEVASEAIIKGIQGIKGKVTPEKIKNLIQSLFGVAIREGYARELKGAVLGIYKPEAQQIRMAKGGLLKLGVLMHELAHHLQNTLGITGGVGYKKRAEGLTDELLEEVSMLDYDVQVFVSALEKALDSKRFKNLFGDIEMPKTRAELLGLIDDWNKKKGIFDKSMAVQLMGDIKKKIVPRPVEGFAEWLRIYATDGMEMAARDDLPPAFHETNAYIDNEVYGAPKFHEWMMKDFFAREGAPADTARNLSIIRTAIKEWRQGGPVKRVLAGFTPSWEQRPSTHSGETEKEKLINSAKARAYSNVVDQYHPFKIVQEDVELQVKGFRKRLEELNEALKHPHSKKELAEIKEEIKDLEVRARNRSTTYKHLIAHSFAAEGILDHWINNQVEAITADPEGKEGGPRKLGPSLISALNLIPGAAFERWKGMGLSKHVLEVQLDRVKLLDAIKDNLRKRGLDEDAVKRDAAKIAERDEAFNNIDAFIMIAAVRGGFFQEDLVKMVDLGLSPGEIVREIFNEKRKDFDNESLRIIGDLDVKALKEAMEKRDWDSSTIKEVVDFISGVEKRAKQRPEADTFDEALGILTDFHRGLVNVLVDAELITPERGKRIMKWDNYIPMMRLSGEAISRWRKKLKKKDNALHLFVPFGYLSQKGSTKQMVDPIEATIRLASEVANTAINQVSLLKLGEEMIPAWGGIKGWEGTLSLIDPDFGKNSVKLEEILGQLGEANILEKEKIALFRGVWALRRHNQWVKNKKPEKDKEHGFFEVVKFPLGVRGLDLKNRAFKSLDVIQEELGIDSSSAKKLIDIANEKFDTMEEREDAVNEYLESLEGLTEGIPDAVTLFTTYFPKWQPADAKEGMYQAIIYRKGKPNLVEMHEEFYKSMHLMVNKYSAGPLQTLLRSIVSVVKKGAVQWNMMFAVKNIIRDLITNNFQAKHQSAVEGVSSPFYWLTIAFFHHAAKEKWPILKNFKGQLNEVVALYEKNGGNMNSWFFGQADGVKGIYKMLERKHMADSRNKGIFNSVKALGRWYVDVVALSDIGPRLSEFYGVLRENGYRVNGEGRMVYVWDKDGKELPVESGVLKTPPQWLVDEARFAAADVTTNFGRQGRLSQYYERETIFLGAATQGFDKQIRTIRDEYKRMKGAKDLGEFASEAVKSRLMWASVVAMSVEIAYYMSRADDDDFIAQPWWERFSYWTMTDGNGKPVIKIPKGYGWSVVANTTHAIWDSFYRQDPEAMWELYNHTMENDVPFSWQSLRNRFPPATLALEFAGNRSIFFDTPIERVDVSRRPVELRYQEDTDWLMKNLGYVTGKTVGLSPQKLEHLINSTTGGMYRRFSDTAGNIATTDFSTGGVLELLYEEFPVVKAYTVHKDHVRDTGEFYDKRTEVQERSEKEKLLQGEVTLETQMERNTLEIYAGLFTDIRKIMRQFPRELRDERFEYEKFLIGAARNALGKEPLRRYPNPFATSMADLPKELRDIIRKIKASQRSKATRPPPVGKYQRHKTYNETWRFWRATQDAARRWLRSQREPYM